MNPHDHEQNPSLTEIEDAAAVAASFWLEQAVQACGSEQLGAKDYPAGIAGGMIASALFYQAERQVDAAIKIADAIDSNTAAIAMVSAQLDVLIGPRFKGKPSRFVEPGEGA